MDLSIFNNTALNLEILAEEAAEVIQAKSKISRFGIEDFHYKNKMNNRLKLEEELGHFLAMVDILIEQKVISEEGVLAGKKAKFKKLPK